MMMMKEELYIKYQQQEHEVNSTINYETWHMLRNNKDEEKRSQLSGSAHTHMRSTTAGGYSDMLRSALNCYGIKQEQ